MTYDQMMTHCKAGGKARRRSWFSGAVTFIEGLQLGVRMTSFGKVYTSHYTPTWSDRAAGDWEAA